MRTTTLAKCLASLAASLVLAALACNQGSEGDRCNPDLASGETDCNGGLQCTTPADCPESYCCPTTGSSSNPYCQPGCNGGAASACNAGDVDACALACQLDPGDLANPDAACAPSSPPEAGPEAASETGAADASAEASKTTEGGPG
jgi:hypothetical protein